MADDTQKIIDHFDTVAEDLTGKIGQVAEGVQANAESLEKLEDVPMKLEQIQARLDTVEATLTGMNIQKELVQLVAHLERRIEALEQQTV